MLVTGAAGVGKTSLIKGFKPKRPKISQPGLASYLDCQVIIKDEMREQINSPVSCYAKYYLQHLRPLIYQKILQAINAGLSQNITVLVDASHRQEIVHEGWEKVYRNIAKKHGAILKIIRLIAHPEIIKQRIRVRKTFNDQEKLKPRIWRKFCQEELREINTIPSDCGLVIANNRNFPQTLKKTLDFIKK